MEEKDKDLLSGENSSDAEAVQPSAVPAPEDTAVDAPAPDTAPSDGEANDTPAQPDTDTDTAAEAAPDAEEEHKPTLLEKGKALFQRLSFPNYIMRFAGIYLLISSFFVMHYDIFNKKHAVRPIGNWQDYRDVIPTLLLVIFVLVGYVLISLLKLKFKRTRLDSGVLLAGLILFSLTTLWKNPSFYYAAAMILMTSVFGYLGIRYDKKHASRKLPFWLVIVLISLLGVGVFAYIASMTVYQYKVYGTSCFDMGIFVQMYHSMITDLSLVTTCERDKFLSHFAVHFSPIYYLLLPFYYIFPRPETLLIAQAALVVSGVIPLVGICRNRKFSNGTILFFSITYLCCAEFIGPCFYDFHENAFLPPLLMWLFYAGEKQKKILLYIFTVLVLLVKEDAPIYIVCIGLCFAFQKGIRKHGVIMAALGSVYFVVVTKLMERFGEGVMTSRFTNLMVDQEAGLGEVFKTVFLDPGYFFSQLIREDNLIFILTVLVPLGMMPFFTKKFSRLFLFVPFLIMNMSMTYGYSHDIGYQYVFGTATCLIYATIINTADLRPKKRQYVAAYTAVASLYMSVAFESGKIDMKDNYKNSKDFFTKQDELLETIPDDASVICDTFYLPHLANRKEVYLLDNNDVGIPCKADFAVVAVNSEYAQPYIAQIIGEGYSLYDSNNSSMEIYVSADYQAKLPVNVN